MAFDSGYPVAEFSDVGGKPVDPDGEIVDPGIDPGDEVPEAGEKNCEQHSDDGHCYVHGPEVNAMSQP